MKFKRITVFILALAIMATTASGCGKQQKTTSNTNTNSGSGVPDYMNADGFPISKEKITIKVMGQKTASQSEWKDLEVIKELEAKTNIHFEFDTPDSSVYSEKLNLALASGDYPDVFMGSAIPADAQDTYGPAGVLVELQDMIPKYVPHLAALMAKNADISRAITSVDGNTYTLPYLVKTKTMPANFLYMDATWLDKVNLKAPTNVDELYTVLKAFKEKDPNGNGKADEIPISSIKFDIINGTILNAFSGQAGGRYNFDIKGDKVIFDPIEPFFKPYLEYLNKLYKEGLWDNESFTQTSQQMNAKGKAGRIGILTGSPSSMLDAANQDKIEMLAPLTSSYNNKQVTNDLDYIVTDAFAITNKCKYPEAVLKMIDLFYRSPEEAVDGFCGISMWFGNYKEHWDYADAGKTKYKVFKKDEKLSMSENVDRYITPGQPVRFPILRHMDAINEGDKWLELKANESDKKYNPYIIPIYPKTVRFTKEQKDQMTVPENDINTYVTQMIAKFATGEEPLSNWDTYVDTVKKMGVDKLIKIRQEAYDKWKSAK
jgi:putative aldouronate transport system substrate-binding protein